MTNLLIGWPDIPSAATRIYTTGTEDTTHSLYNSAAGPRHLRTTIGDGAADFDLNFDLGTSYDTSRGIAEYVIVSHADLTQTVANLGVLSDSAEDFSTATSVYLDSSYSSATLYGPYSNDYVATFTASSTARYWRVRFYTGSGTLAFGKVYLGQWFDFGREPSSYDIEREPSKSGVYYTPAGTSYSYRLDEPVYRFRFTWDAITDDKVTEFFNYIVSSQNTTPVFLYTATNHEILDSQRLVHCRLVSHSVDSPAGVQDWNRVQAEFVQILG